MKKLNLYLVLSLLLLVVFSCQNEERYDEETSKVLEGKINVTISETFTNEGISSDYGLIFRDNETGLLHNLDATDADIETFLNKKGSTKVSVSGKLSSENNILN